MQPSMFNVRVPVSGRNEVFMMNTLSDAQLLVSADVADLLDRVGRGDSTFRDDERETVDVLRENGFLVSSREHEQRELQEYLTGLRGGLLAALRRRAHLLAQGVATHGAARGTRHS